jgi:hypothetical protein
VKRQGRPILIAGWLLAALSLSPTGVAEAGGRGVQRPRVTVFLLPAQGISSKVLARLSDAFVKALQENRQIDVRDSDKLLVEFAGEEPSDIIAGSKQAYEEGLKALKEKRAGEAVGKLLSAVKGFEEVIAFVEKNLLAKAMLALGVAQAEAGSSKAAIATFTSLLNWRHQVVYDTEAFDPRHLGLFEKARTAVGKRPRGSVELVTMPPGAKAYVDGRFMGVTPTLAYGLRIGDHYATYKLTGFIKAAQKISVHPDEQTKFEQDLRRSDKFLLLQQSLVNGQKGLGQPTANQGMLDLKTFLYIEQVIFATIGYAGPDRVQVAAYLYDLRSKLRLSLATLYASTATFVEIPSLCRQLYFNVRIDGVLEAPPEPPPPPQQKRRPFYATWWFWTAIAVGTAGIVIPVVLVPERKTCPEGFRCAALHN